MDSDDLTAWFAKVHFFGLLDHQLDKIVSSLIRGNLISSDSASDVELSDDGKRYRACEDWHTWSVLGHEAGHMASVSQNNNEIDVKIEGS